jgi:hypothetical protein
LKKASQTFTTHQYEELLPVVTDLEVSLFDHFFCNFFPLVHYGHYCLRVLWVVVMMVVVVMVMVMAVVVMVVVVMG